MGRARGGAGRGRRTPADRRAPSSGSRWRARWRRRRTGRPCGRGASGRRTPPAGRRCRGSRTRRRRIRIRPDSIDGFYAAFGRLSSLGQSAPSSSAGPRRPSAECVPDFAMPMRGGGALSVRALKWAGESGRTRKGRRPAPTPPNETNRFQGRRARASRPAATPKSNRAPRAFFSVPGSKKEGPAVSGGPLGDPWWSLGGSNP